MLRVAVPVMIAPFWREATVTAMGSTAHVIVGDAPEGILAWMLDELDRLERCWSRFDPASELVALNANSGRWVEVSTTLADAVRHACALAVETGGVFDPTVLPALDAIGYDRTFAEVERDDPRPIEVHGHPIGVAGVHLDGRMAFLEPGLRIDLGGVGKGLAADRLAQGAVDRGARSALVSCGGDLRAAGEAPDGGWPIPVETPDGRALWTHPLVSGGLAMSTRAIRTWRRGDREVHHLIDPGTRLPADTDLGAAVVADHEAARAEGLAKAAVILGRRAGADLLERAGVAGWLLDADHRIVATAGPASVPEAMVDLRDTVVRPC